MCLAYFSFISLDFGEMPANKVLRERGKLILILFCESQEQFLKNTQYLGRKRRIFFKTDLTFLPQILILDPKTIGNFDP